MDSSTPVESRPTRSRTGEALCVAVIGIVASVLAFWCVTQPSLPLVDAVPPGMYGLLTEAYAAGQVHLKVEPDAALLALPDPYDPVANARFRLHDATLFEGKYYLYFGSAPVLIAMLPWRLLTGTYLTQPAAVALFTAGGIAAALALLLRVRRDLPGVPRIAFLVAALVPPFGSMAGYLLHYPGFYEVPIASAGCFLMVSMYFLLLALQSDHGAVSWLSISSAAFAVAMASRPHFVFAAAVVMLPAMLCVSRRAGLRLVLAASYLPIGLVGVSLLVHNQVRFGSFFEFGVKYQLAGASQIELQVFDVARMVAGLREYLAGAADFSRYFPFFIGGENGLFGVLWGVPLLWLVPLLLLARRNGHARDAGRSTRTLLASLMVAWIAVLALLASYHLQVDRYFIDIYPGAALAGLLAWLSLVDAQVSRPVRRATLAFGMAAVAYMLAVNLAVGASRFAAPAKLATLGRLLDEPAAAWERLTGVLPGPRVLTVVFPAGAEGRSEPLLSTGSWRSRADVLYAEYLPGNQVRLAFFHVGMGGPVSDPLPIRAGEEQVLEVIFGGLMPPTLHPVFRGWSDRQVEVALRTVRVTLDGKVVIDTMMDSHASRPNDVQVGAVRWDYWYTGRKFTGAIRSVETPGVVPSLGSEPDIPAHAPLALDVRMPRDQTWLNQPLLALGKPGAHDLIYLEFGDPGKVRISLNHHGHGGPRSDWLDYNPDESSRFLLWIPSLSDSTADSGAWRDRFFVTLNGRVALDVSGQEMYPVPEGGIRFGANPFGAGSAGVSFPGRLERAAPQRVGALPVPADRRSFGSVSLDLEFRGEPDVLPQPLVVTGLPGAGDFVYCQVLEGGQVRFGFDHWGQGGVISEPVSFVPGRTYRVDIHMGSLLDPETGADDNRAAVTVKLDKQVVLDATSDFHPATPDTIHIGSNPIGGSTTGPEFLGKIHYVFRGYGSRPAR
jgi:hypothetical protein